MALTLETVKLYLRVDSDEEDPLLEELIAGAKAYVERLTGKPYDDADPVWNQCIKYLCSHWYTNRDDTMGGRDAKIDHTIDALIQHIALSESYKESEESP